MVIFKLFTGIVKIGWVRVIYDGSGNFQVFSGFLWPKLRVPHCMSNFLTKLGVFKQFMYSGVRVILAIKIPKSLENYPNRHKLPVRTLFLQYP